MSVSTWKCKQSVHVRNEYHGRYIVKDRGEDLAMACGEEVQSNNDAVLSLI